MTVWQAKENSSLMKAMITGIYIDSQPPPVFLPYTSDNDEEEMPKAKPKEKPKGKPNTQPKSKSAHGKDKVGGGSCGQSDGGSAGGSRVAMVVVLRKSRCSSNTSSKLYEKNVLL